MARIIADLSVRLHLSVNLSGILSHCLQQFHSPWLHRTISISLFGNLPSPMVIYRYLCLAFPFCCGLFHLLLSDNQVSSLSACLSVCKYFCLSIYLSVSLSACLSVCDKKAHWSVSRREHFYLSSWAAAFHPAGLKGNIHVLKYGIWIPLHTLHSAVHLLGLSTSDALKSYNY